VIIKAERLLTSLGLLALEVGLRIRNGRDAFVHLLTSLLHETLPELLLLFTAFADLADRGIDPFGETTEEGHEVRD
jgi:hypothetical protein